MAELKVNANSEHKIEANIVKVESNNNSGGVRAAVKVELAATVSDHRDSVVGERNFAANLKQFQLNNTQIRSFAATQTGGPTGYAPDAPTAKEAADILKNEDNFISDDQRANAFAATLYKHQGDAAFAADLFRELGPELSAKLVTDTTRVENGELYDYQNDTVQTFDAGKTVAEGLGLADHQLSGTWDAAFTRAATADPGTAMAAAQTLRQIPSADGSYLHKSFLNAVMTPDRALSAAGDDGSVDSWMYARAAGEVLGANPDLAQKYLGKGGTLTDGQRGQLIDNAARFGTEGRNGFPFWSSHAASWNGFDKALAGLPPADLQNILEKNGSSMKTYLDKLGSDYYTKDDPSLGNLLKTAARITDANGNSTPEALQLFFDAIPKIKGNPAAKEGAGTFFVKHAKEIVDLATGYGGTNPDAAKMNNLKSFFAEAYFAPDAQNLKFRVDGMPSYLPGAERPLTDAIKDSLDSVRGRILNQANDASASTDPNTRDRETKFAGFELASLTGIVTDGLIEAAQTYKSDFEKNEALQEKVVNLALTGIDKLAEKAGVPSEATGKVKELLMDLVKNKLNAGKDEQKAAFQKIYDEIKFVAEAAVVKFSRDNNLNGDLLEAYKIGVTEYQTSFSNEARLN